MANGNTRYDSQGRRYFGSVSEYKEYVRSIDRTKRAEPTPGKATITRERVVTDPLTGEITRRETTFGGTELEIKERSPKTGKLEVVSRDFAPKQILPYIRAERRGNDVSKMTVRDLQEVGYTPREATALYKQEQRRMSDKELDRNIRLGEMFARGRASFMSEEDRIIGQAYATGRPVQIDENLIGRFQKKYGQKEGTTKALELIRKTSEVAYVTTKKPLRGTVQLKQKNILQPMSSRVKEKTSPYKITAPERTLVQESRALGLNTFELKTFRKEYFKEDINKYKKFARAQGYKIYFDEQGYILKDAKNNVIKDFTGKEKAKRGTIAWAYVEPMKELSKKIKGRVAAGKLGALPQVYAQKTETVRGASGQKIYVRPGGAATAGSVQLATTFLGSYAVGFVATKLALRVPGVAKALKSTSGALTTMYVGGVGYNVYRDRKDPKKVVVTLVKEATMLGGTVLGSRMAQRRFLRPNKSDYEIQKNVFGRTYTTKLPNKKTLTTALNSAQSKEAKDRILLSIYRTVGARTGRFPVLNQRLVGIQRGVEIHPGLFKEKIKITSNVISKKDISFVKKLPRIKNQLVVSGKTLEKITTKNASFMINKRGHYRVTFREGEPFVLERIKESVARRMPKFKKGLTQQAQRGIISKNQKELQAFRKRYNEVLSKINKKDSFGAQDRIEKARYNDILKRIQYNIRQKQKEIIIGKKKYGSLPREKKTVIEGERDKLRVRPNLLKIVSLKPYRGKAKLKETNVGQIKKLQLKYPKKTKKQLEAMGVIVTKGKIDKSNLQKITLKQLEENIKNVVAESRAKTQASAQKQEEENIKNAVRSGKSKQITQTVLSRAKTANKQRSGTNEPIISSKYYIDQNNEIIYIPTGRQIDGTTYKIGIGKQQIPVIGLNQNIQPSLENMYRLDSKGRLKEKPIIISSEKFTPERISAIIPIIQTKIEQNQFQTQIPSQKKIEQIIQQQIQPQKIEKKTVQTTVPIQIKRPQLPTFLPPKVPKNTEDAIYKSIKKIQAQGKKPKIIYSYTPTLSGLGKKATKTKGMFTGFEVRGSIVRLKPIVVKKHKRKTLVNKNFVRRHRRRKAKLFRPHR